MPWMISCWPGARTPDSTSSIHMHAYKHINTHTHKHPTQWPVWPYCTTHTHTHHRRRRRCSSGVSSSLFLFISVPERDACHVISRGGFLNACVTYALIRDVREGWSERGEVERQAWEARRGRAISETDWSGGNMPGKKKISVEHNMKNTTGRRERLLSWVSQGGMWVAATLSGQNYDGLPQSTGILVNIHKLCNRHLGQPLHGFHTVSSH